MSSPTAKSNWVPTVIGVIVVAFFWYSSSPGQPSHWLSLIALIAGLVVLVFQVIVALTSKKDSAPKDA